MYQKEPAKLATLFGKFHTTEVQLWYPFILQQLE